MEVVTEATYDALLTLESKLGLSSRELRMAERLTQHAVSLGRPTCVEDVVAFADYVAAFDTLASLTETATWAAAWNRGLRSYYLVHPRETRSERARSENWMMSVRPASGVLLGGAMNQAGGRRR